MHNKMVHLVAFALLAVGGINWLLVGALNMNLVTMIFGEGTMLTKVVYILVGLSAILELITHRGRCADCK